MNSNSKKVRILNSYINPTTFKFLQSKNINWVKKKKGHYICISNVHQTIEAYNHKEFAEIVNNADLAVPDGRPIYWALKLLNYKDTEHLHGHYVTKKLCKFSSENNIKVGFFGGENKTLNKCISNLKKEFEKLTIGYAYSPPFRTLTNEEKKEIINNINRSEIEILFVCLGCPKQEFWMAEHKDYLKCTSIGIGAAIEFISGKKIVPFKWITKMGLWWLVRLISEPRRLFWRYFYTNSKFIYLFMKQYFKFKLK